MREKLLFLSSSEPNKTQTAEGPGGPTNVLEAETAKWGQGKPTCRDHHALMHLGSPPFKTKKPQVWLLLGNQGPQ